MIILNTISSEAPQILLNPGGWEGAFLGEVVKGPYLYSITNTTIE